MDQITIEVAGIRLKLTTENRGLLSSMKETYKKFIKNDQLFDYSILVYVKDLNDYIDESKLPDGFKMGKMNNRMFLSSYDSSRKEAQLITSPNNAFFNIESYLLSFLNQVVSDQNMILFHSASLINQPNSLYLFYGPSCVGKTTLSHNSKFKILSDDLVIINYQNGRKVQIYKTPFTRDKSRKNDAETFEFQGLYRLWQSEKESVEKMTTTEAFAQFLGNLWDVNLILSNATLQNKLKSMLNEVPSYHLNFKRSSKVEKIILDVH